MGTIFWDALYSHSNASTDIEKVVVLDHDLAVLHNRNGGCLCHHRMVAGSGGAVISRSVTSSAGMTAYLALLAQTRVGS